MDDLLSGASSANVGRGGVLLPEGFYPELRLVSAEVFQQQTGRKPRTFSCNVEVLVGPEGVAAGTFGSGPFEQLEFSDFPSYDVEARGRVMQLLGALYGYANKSEIDANVNGQTLSLVVSPAQPMTGGVFSARVTHKTSKKGKTIQKFTEIAPVLENGKPKVVRGPLKAGNVGASANTNVSAPAPVAPPPPAPAAPAVPAGWLPHPQAPGWFYNPANPQEQKQIA